MGNIWITSDFHFCHDREFVYKPRGFNCVRDMNEAIVKNYNQLVQPNDDVYVLGDLMLSDNITGMKLLRNLKGRIHIIGGNHDTDERVRLYRTAWNVEEVIMGCNLQYNGWRFFLSHYPSLCGYYEEGKRLKNCRINLCGHTHTNNRFADMDKGIIYHCELNAHNNKPVNIDEIIDDIKTYFNK